MAQPEFDLQDAEIRVFTVKAAAAATQYRLVKFGAADNEVEDASAGDIGCGIALETKAAGARVRVALLGGNGRVPVKVGTGGATRGKLAKGVATGLTDATPAGAGTTATPIVGFFMQSGVAGEVVGLRPAMQWVTE